MATKIERWLPPIIPFRGRVVRTIDARTRDQQCLIWCKDMYELAEKGKRLSHQEFCKDKDISHSHFGRYMKVYRYHQGRIPVAMAYIEDVGSVSKAARKLPPDPFM